jgi:hypothetical protein
VLLEPCRAAGPYDVDTSNTLSLLEEALRHGQRDALARRRESSRARDPRASPSRAG